MEQVITVLAYFFGIFVGWIIFSEPKRKKPSKQEQINELRQEIKNLVDGLTTKTK